jgi:Ca2+-binding RTX toxin-like protein
MFDDLDNDGDVAANERDDIRADVENLLAGAGNDEITGNALNNAIEGRIGNDILRGGEGDDQLDGNDAAANVLECGGGTDIALNAGTGSYARDCEITGR